MTFVVLLLEFDVGLRVKDALVLVHIVAIDGARHGERGEGVEALWLLLVTRKVNATHHRQLHFVAQFAVKVIDEGMIAGILVIGQNQLAVDDIRKAQHVFLFRDELLPVIDAWLADVCRHNASLRCTIVGIEVYLVAFVVDGVVLVVHIVGELDELRVLLAQVAHKQVVTSTGT